MGNKTIPELGFCGSYPAIKYRADIGQQLVFCAADDCDYDIGGCFMPFLEYLQLLQDEWARIH